MNMITTIEASMYFVGLAHHSNKASLTISETVQPFTELHITITRRPPYVHNDIVLSVRCIYEVSVGEGGLKEQH